MKKSYEDKIKAVFDNETFAKKFAELDNIENVGTLFAEFGVELTEEELADFIKTPVESKQSKSDELDENDLESVAGGGAISRTWKFAENYWGGTRQAAQATYDSWYDILHGTYGSRSYGG